MIFRFADEIDDCELQFFLSFKLKSQLVKIPRALQLHIRFLMTRKFFVDDSRWWPRLIHDY